MKLKIGQTWLSDSHPHESFKIYDGIVDTCVDAFEDESIPFDEQPETVKVFFWERVDFDSFISFVEKKTGNIESTYPYAWSSECKKSSLIRKIRKYNMYLAD